MNERQINTPLQYYIQTFISKAPPSPTLQLHVMDATFERQYVHFTSYWHCKGRRVGRNTIRMAIR